MLSRKNRVVALFATCAVAAALAIPAFAQALWIDTLDIDPSGGSYAIDCYADSRSSAQTVSVNYYTEGPSLSGPATVNVPAYTTHVTVPVTIGPGNSGDYMNVGMSGPTTRGGCEIMMY
jgi:hypothetical protein